MAEQLERTDIPWLVVGLEIGKFWWQLQHVPMQRCLAVEDLNLDTGAAQRRSQVQQSDWQRAQRSLVEIFHRRLDEEDFHGNHVQRLWCALLSVYYPVHAALMLWERILTPALSQRERGRKPGR